MAILGLNKNVFKQIRPFAFKPDLFFLLPLSPEAPAKGAVKQGCKYNQDNHPHIFRFHMTYLLFAR
jgi:hypothetical protein